MQDPYRIRLENGEIAINLFERGKPIPHTSYKGKIDSSKTKDFINKVINKFSDKDVVDLLSFFVENSKFFKDRINSDWKELSKEFGK